MKDAIIEKLRAILHDGVDNEPKVVYLLCECRKLLEKYPIQPSPFALLLYCNWAVHLDLDRPRTTLPFLQRIEEFVASVFDRKKADIALENRIFREFVFFDTFRDQLRELLRGYGLPTSLCDDEIRWHGFIKHYAGVIQDGSLACEARNSQGKLKWVQKVIFEKGRNRPNGHTPFDLVWDIQLTNGDRLQVEVNAARLGPAAIQAIFHGLRVIKTPPVEASRRK